MGIALNLMAARQGATQHTVVMWSGQDATAKSLVLIVARRRLDADEVEQAATAGHVEADRVVVPASAGAVVDDLTSPGEPRYYGVLAVAADGSFKPTRFRAGPMAELPEGTLKYSSIGGKALGGAMASAPGPVRGAFAPGAAAPVPGPAPVTGSAFVRATGTPPSAESAPGPVRGPFALGSPPPAPLASPTTGAFAVRGPFSAGSPSPAPLAAPTTGAFAVRAPVSQAFEAPSIPAPPAPPPDPMEARRQAQLRAQQAAASASAAPAQASEPAPAIDPMEARRQAQARAHQAAAAASADPAPGGDDPMASRRGAQARARTAPAETVPPPSDFPVGRFGLRMSGGTQSWDGLRILWEGEGKEAAAYEVFIADHPLSPDEVSELVTAGRLDGAAVKAFSPSVKAVIDNVTPRDARGYYAVVARNVSGGRELVGCAAQGFDECQVRKAPFFDPSALEEVRSLANGQVREARVQLMIFREEQDVGAWREALRMTGDALVIYPDFPEAIALEQEIRAARQV